MPGLNPKIKSVRPSPFAPRELGRRLIRSYRTTTLVVFGLVVVAGYLLVLRGTIERASVEGSTDFGQLQAQQEYLQGYVKDLEAMVNNLEAISQTDIDRLSAILPDEKGVGDLLVQLQTLSETHGFFLSSVNVSQGGTATEAPTTPAARQAKPKATSPIQRMSISVVLQGPGYTEIKELLSSIERNLRVLDVNAVYFTPGSPDVTLNLYAYYLTPQ